MATVGYGVVLYTDCEQYQYIASGIIQTLPGFSAGHRLSIIRSDLLNLIEQYKPEVLAVETLFFFKNVKTAMSVAEAKGVILEAAQASSVPVVEYTPMQVKLTLTGFGRADKRSVQHTITRLLTLPDIVRPDDAADALALAVCHARMTLAIEAKLENAG